MARKSTGKRLRFEIFKRDGFRCVYCGATPVQSVLRVDHVNPVAKCGTDDPANLVTACVDCNGGKSDIPLDQNKYRPAVASEEQKEHLEQIREYLELQKQVSAARLKAAEALAQYWEQHLGPMSQDWFNKLQVKLRTWPHDKLTEAIDITARRMGSPGQEFNRRLHLDQVRYFCGVLRKWRQEEAKPRAMTATERALLDAAQQFAQVLEYNVLESDCPPWRTPKYPLVAEHRADIEHALDSIRSELDQALPGWREM